MSSAELIAAVMFALVTSITPGPNNAMLMASGINFGFARTLPQIVGISLGFPIMLLAVGFGFGELFDTWRILHRILGMLGAIYLLYLAWQIARAGSLEIDAHNRARPMTIFEAAVFQWVNPKAWIVATGAVAVLLKPDSFEFRLVTLAILYGMVSLPCVALWAAGGEVIGLALTKPRQRRAFNICMAALLVASILLPLLMSWPGPSAHRATNRI